jgi:hypothetical protein
MSFFGTCAMCNETMLDRGFGGRPLPVAFRMLPH